MSIKIFNYEGSPIQFDEVNGQIMANATLMAIAFGKKPDDIFKTKSWTEYETAVIETKNLRFEDIRTVKNGENGGSWINEQLVIEFARRLNPKFSIWCNEKIAELLRTGKVELKPLTPAELILQQAQQLVEHERRLDDIDLRVKKIEAHQIVVNHTIMGYANIKRCKINTEDAKVLGKKASQLCKDRGLETGLVPDPRYTQVKSYPKEVLEEVFNAYLGIEKNY